MAHVVLLGDSIFDNAAYVADHPAVLQQTQRYLPEGYQASLLAIDGDTIQDVWRQLSRLPKDASHLVISVGGNDTLGYAQTLLSSAQSSAWQMLDRVASMRAEFEQNYQQMLTVALSHGKPIALCTIYDRCPLLDPTLQRLAYAVLPTFNDCITRQAVQAKLPLIDLRVLCNEESDYSPISPIEPSVSGGEKIAKAIATLVTTHDFSQPRTVIYSNSHQGGLGGAGGVAPCVGVTPPFTPIKFAL
jgi:lysophospholipase L1-like esterase